MLKLFFFSADIFLDYFMLRYKSTAHLLKNYYTNQNRKKKLHNILW